MSTEQDNAEKKLSVWSKLYRGETDYQFVAYRKRWYLSAAVIVVAAIVLMLFKGFTLGIDFVGGNQYTVPVTSGASLAEVEEAAADAGADIASGQETGGGADLAYVIRTAAVDADDSRAIQEAMGDVAGTGVDAISTSEVSGTWGASVSRQALIALLVFLALISVFIWIRFESRMAVAAVAALIFDLILTAGIYSLVGFEVTPSTMVGALTILAYSLYDTVVVFDKVRENTANLLQSRQKTYAEGVNDAINETLMRSLNTSVIGALPVGALLFIGVGLLGVGTLKDLALVLFVGVIFGTFSSIFLAAPWLVDMTERSAVYKRHNKKIESRRSGKPEAATGDDTSAADEDDLELELVEEPTTAGPPPRPNRANGARPQQRRRKRR